jgi:hypothetical protein
VSEITSVLALPLVRDGTSTRCAYQSTASSSSMSEAISRDAFRSSRGEAISDREASAVPAAHDTGEPEGLDDRASSTKAPPLAARDREKAERERVWHGSRIGS